ncbi:hypothetical protein D6D08_02674 [Aureobasidium pullulans]|nr:hypothetical protein D6D08_02674 [Aureobasidium pullulans]
MDNMERIQEENQKIKVIHLRQESRISQLGGEINAITIQNDILQDNLTALNANAAEETAKVKEHNVYIDYQEKVLKRKKTKIGQLRGRLTRSKGINRDLQERNDYLEERLATKKIKSQAFKAEQKELKRSKKDLERSIRCLDEQLEEDQTEILVLLKKNVKYKKLIKLHEQQLFDAGLR